MNRRLTILLTNIALAEPAGSEVVVRDLALGLLRRGHRPIVYSPTLGAVADALVSRGVTVIDDLRKLGEPPDIIHGHHCIPGGEALIRFPHVPAIYVCHSFEVWLEGPIHFPQIGAYVAVDEACRDRLVHREGIDPKCVVVLHNAVDLRRIPPRPRPLEERPKRAVAFAKAAGMPELRLACGRLGIEYEAIGAAAGRVVAQPEQELVHCDLVFGSARAALEGLCCGCAVIVCDNRGFAGLVTQQNFATLRARNFGLRCLSEVVTVDRCVAEIGRYDPAEASLVAERAREEANLEKLLDEFEKLYLEVLDGARQPQVTAESHHQAVTRFLHENLPRRPGDARWPWLAEREQFQREIQSYQRAVVEFSDYLDKMERDQAKTWRQPEALGTRGSNKTVAIDADQLENSAGIGGTAAMRAQSPTSAAISGGPTRPPKVDALFIRVRMEGGRALSSGEGYGAPQRAFDRRSDTFWVSQERGALVRDNAWLGFEFPARERIGRLVLTQPNNAGFRQDLVEVQYGDRDDEEWCSAVLARIPRDETKSFIDLREPVRACQWRVVARSDNAIEEAHAWTPVSLEFFSPAARGPAGS